MKRVILFISIMFIPSIIQAQRVKFGFKGGLNLANQISNQVSFPIGVATNDKNRVSFHAGIYSQLIVGNKFGIQPEVIYSQQGARDSNYPANNAMTTYINVPIMLRYEILRKVDIQSGPQMGILVNARFSNGVSNRELYNSKEFAWAFGSGIDLPWGLRLTLRYILGRSNIINNNAQFYNRGQQPQHIYTANKVFQISVEIQCFEKH